MRNVNKADTKCSLQLFKIHPLVLQHLTKTTDLLIKSKSFENNSGYIWDNFNNYCNFKEFTPCEEKDIPEYDIT